jgi:hypothetical protein
MNLKAISLAAAFSLAGTAALAQTGPSGASPQTGAGPVMKDGATGTTTGSSKPSAKDASTQGAGTAGAVDKKGDAASPGGTMKK